MHLLVRGFLQGTVRATRAFNTTTTSRYNYSPLLPRLPPLLAEFAGITLQPRIDFASLYAVLTLR